MAYDLKYGRVTTDRGKHMEHEPVFILRARDTAAVRAIECYLDICQQFGSPEHHIAGVEDAIREFEIWQEKNSDKVRVPRSDSLDPGMDNLNFEYREGGEGGI